MNTTAETETTSRATIAALDALPPDERRAILAAWLSDANAVPGFPALRRAAGGITVAVDDLLAALRGLDGAGEEAALADPVRPSRPVVLRRRRSRIQGGDLRVLLGRHRRDDDDDPPPCPAAAARPVPLAGLAAA